MRVTKYHGLGNDFVIIRDRDLQHKNYSEYAKQLCDRESSIGADGLISVKENPLEMVYYNSDGSRAKMCGNGIRCFAKYVFDEGLNSLLQYDVVTLAGIMKIHVKSIQPFIVEVDMGKADYTPNNVPVISSHELIEEVIVLPEDVVFVTSLLMGATHSLIEVDELNKENMIRIGTQLNNHEMYPEGTNVNFYKIVDKNTIHMQTFERGAGLTLACGTGACAVVEYNQRVHKVHDTVTVSLPLGDLHIRNQNGNMMMSGPSEKSNDLEVRMEDQS